MKKLTPYQLKKISNNLDKFFNNATQSQIFQGKIWYKQAYGICVNASEHYNRRFTVLQCASVLSALSPRNKWEQNIKDMHKVLEAVNNNVAPEDIKVCTFHTNKFKAFALAKGEIEFTAKGSLKTFNFVNNIATLSNEFLTVDIWHLRACFDKVIKIDSASIGKIAYGQIKKLTIKKASKLGLKGYEFQAIVWGSIRDSYNKKAND